jgi:hypothetical protein
MLSRRERGRDFSEGERERMKRLSVFAMKKLKP